MSGIGFPPKIDGFVKKSNFCVALHLSSFNVRKVRLIPRDSRALNLELFTLPFQIDFYETIKIIIQCIDFTLYTVKWFKYQSIDIGLFQFSGDFYETCGSEQSGLNIILVRPAVFFPGTSMANLDMLFRVSFFSRANNIWSGVVFFHHIISCI